MNLTKTALSILLIAAVFFAGYFIRGCSHEGGKVSSVDTVKTVEVKYDTVRHTKTQKVTVPPDTIYQLKTDTVKDTAYVYKDYFNYKWFTHSYRDTNIDLELRAGIWQNRLDSVKLDYNLFTETKTVTNTITKTKPYSYKVLAGASVELNRLKVNASIDFNGVQVGIYRNVLSRNKPKEIEKWGVRFEGVLFQN